MGGNFVSAMSDTDVTEDAMRRADLTVHVSTKLNRSHVVTGREALILPVLGRSEKDRTGGREQRVTVEDSMSAVHASKGPLDPASPHLRSEVDIVCSLALATLGADHPVPWARLRDDYTEIRRRIARVVPGCESYDEKVDQPGGFVLPHPPRDSRTFPTDVERAKFTVSPIDVLHVPEGGCCSRRCGRTTSSTPRSTASTTATAASPAVAGWCSCIPTTSPRSGSTEGDLVDLVSEWTDGSERQAPRFRVVAYDQPRGCAAAYYPETNPLVPLDHVAEGSNCPSSKSIIVRLDPTQADGPDDGRQPRRQRSEGSADATTGARSARPSPTSWR